MITVDIKDDWKCDESKDIQLQGSLRIRVADSKAYAETKDTL